MDLSPGMLREAEPAAAALVKRGLPVDLALMDAEALRFADRSFDSVLDTFSLCVYAVDPSKGQKFSWLQLVGFAILLSGTLVYNEILPLPCLPKKWRKAAATAEEAGEAACARLRRARLRRTPLLHRL